MPLTIEQFKKKYPAYTDWPNDHLANQLHKKFYAHKPKQDFLRQILPREDIIGKEAVSKDVPPSGTAKTLLGDIKTKVQGAGRAELRIDEPVNGKRFSADTEFFNQERFPIKELQFKSVFNPEGEEAKLPDKEQLVLDNARKVHEFINPDLNPVKQEAIRATILNKVLGKKNTPDINAALKNTEFKLLDMVTSKRFIQNILEDVIPKAPEGKPRDFTTDIIDMITMTTPLTGFKQFTPKQHHDARRRITIEGIGIMSAMTQPDQIVVMGAMSAAYQMLKPSAIKGYQWVRSIFRKAKVSPGDASSTVRQKLIETMADETAVQIRKTPNTLNAYKDMVDKAVAIQAAEQSAGLYKNVIAEKGKGTGKAFKDIVLQPKEITPGVAVEKAVAPVVEGAVKPVAKVTPEISPEPAQVEDAIYKVKNVNKSGNKIEILPDKRELLKSINDAIDVAPETTAGLPESTKTITFKIDGGAKISNNKEALEKFRGIIEKTPASMVMSRTKLPGEAKTLGKGLSPTTELLDDITITEDGKYYNDGRIIIKGIPPKGAKLNRESNVKTKLVTDLIADAEKRATPAKKLYYVENDPDIGLSLSKKQIPASKKAGIHPEAIFESNGKFYRYDQFRLNVIDKRFPSADYSITTEPGARSQGALIVKVKDETVAVLMPIKEPLTSPPFAEEARQAGLLSEAKEPPPPPKTPKDTFAEMGGFADSEIAQAPPFIELPELVEIAKNITGKYPLVVKKALRSLQALGVAQFRNKEKDAVIKLYKEIFKDPGLARKVLAHEIGHVVDWLPHNVVTKGNILGKIASLKRYMKSFLEEFPGAPGEPLTAKDIAKLNRLAEKLAKQEVRVTPEIKPEEVLAIWKDVKAREKFKPLNDYIAGLSREQKVEIMKAAIKGKIPEWVDFGKVYKDATPDVKAIFQKLLRDEIEKRKLFEKDAIMKELKTLTQKWKPFKEGLNPHYTRYRFSTPELYADAVSVLLNNPELLKTTAPGFYKGFFNFLERKPVFMKTYLSILERAKNGKADILKTRDESLEKMFKKGEDIRSKLIKDNKGLSIWTAIQKEMINTDIPKIKMIQAAKKKGIIVPPDKDPIYLFQEYPYLHAQAHEYLRTIENKIKKPLEKIGITEMDINKYMFAQRAATELAKKGVAAPLGFDKQAALDELAFLEAKLGKEKYNELVKMMSEYGRIRKDQILPYIKKAELFDDKLQSFIDSNVENYAKWNVLFYLENTLGKEGAKKVYHQVGTFQEIEKPLNATILQDISLLRTAHIKMEKHNFINVTQPAFPEQVTKDQVSPFQEQIRYLHKGKIKTFWVPKEIAKNFNEAPIEAGRITRVIQYITAPLKEILATKNPFFPMWNIQRDTRSLAKNVSGANIPKALWYIGKSIPDTYKDVFGNVSTEVVSKLYREKMIPVGRYYKSLDQPSEKTLDKILQSYGLSETTYHNRVLKPFLKLWEYMDKPAQFTERVVKTGGYKLIMAEREKQILKSLNRQGVISDLSYKKLLSRVINKKGVPLSFDDLRHDIDILKVIPEGMARQGTPIDIPISLLSDKEIGRLVRERVGTPDVLAGGHLKMLYNSLFMFSNVGMKGWEASIHAAKANPLSYTWKVAKYDLMPKIMMYAAAIGALGWMAKRMMDNIPERDKANYITIPLGIIIREEGREKPQFKNVFSVDEGGLQGKEFKTVYLVFPHDFMGQTISGLLWMSANKNKASDITKAIDFVNAEQPYSSLNPVVAMGLDLFLYTSGKNPYDTWSGRNVIPQTVFDTYPSSRTHKAFLRHAWNTLGGSAWHRFRVENIKSVESELETLLKKPGLAALSRRFIRISDWGYREQLREEKYQTRRLDRLDLLDAKDVMYKLIDTDFDTSKLTEVELNALAKKPDLIESMPIMKMMFRKSGEVALEEILSATSLKEREAVIKKYLELTRK